MNHWTPREDAIFMKVLTESVAKGETLTKAFENISQALTDRSSETCSFRWYTVLQKVEKNKMEYNEAKKIGRNKQSNKKRITFVKNSNWNDKETEVLIESFLKEIEKGKKYHEATEAVAKLLPGRSSDGCGKRWRNVMNEELKKRYQEAKEKGKIARGENIEQQTTFQHQISFDESEVESNEVESKTYNEEIKKAEQFVNMYKTVLEENAELKRELEISKRNNSRLIKENDMLTKDVQSFADIFNKARKIAISDEVSPTSTRFNMDRNGNLNRN